MADKNVTIKRWDTNTTTWDIIYPKTIAGNIIDGELDLARIPTIPGSKIATIDVTQLRGEGGAKIAAALLPAIAITDVTVLDTGTTMASWITTYYNSHRTEFQEGDIIIVPTDNVTWIRSGAAATGTISDFIQLATPTDVVTSVNGYTGAVELDKGDVGLGNVTNHAQMKKIAASTNGYIPTWSGITGDTLGTGYAVSGTGSVAMTNNPAFTGTPTIGTGSNTWKITDETPNRLEFINGGTIILPKVSVTKTIAFEEDVQSAITLTASRAVISGTDGKLAASSVTSTEVGYLSGLNVNVQTGKQHYIKMGLNSALPASSTFNGDIYLQTD